MKEYIGVRVVEQVNGLAIYHKGEVFYFQNMDNGDFLFSPPYFYRSSENDNNRQLSEEQMSDARILAIIIAAYDERILAEKGHLTKDEVDSIINRFATLKEPRVFLPIDSEVRTVYETTTNKGSVIDTFIDQSFSELAMNGEDLNILMVHPNEMEKVNKHNGIDLVTKKHVELYIVGNQNIKEGDYGHVVINSRMLNNINNQIQKQCKTDTPEHVTHMNSMILLIINYINAIDYGEKLNITIDSLTYPIIREVVHVVKQTNKNNQPIEVDIHVLMDGAKFNMEFSAYLPRLKRFFGNLEDVLNGEINYLDMFPFVNSISDGCSDNTNNDSNNPERESEEFDIMYIATYAVGKHHSYDSKSLDGYAYIDVECEKKEGLQPLNLSGRIPETVTVSVIRMDMSGQYVLIVSDVDMKKPYIAFYGSSLTEYEEGRYSFTVVDTPFILDVNSVIDMGIINAENYNEYYELIQAFQL